MFVVLESIDGGGKGEQREQIVKYYKKKGVKIESKEFPDHDTCVWNEYLHPALHNEKYLSPGGWFSAFAFEKFLWEDSLKKFKGDPNNLFLADGYYTTTLVYQCVLQNKPKLEFGVEFAKELGIIQPDLAIYIDVHPKTALARKYKEEGKERKDMFEDDIQKQNWIQGAFQRMVKEQIWCNWVQVDGNGSIPEVRDLVLGEMEKLHDN